jgi:hypothetical protein
MKDRFISEQEQIDQWSKLYGRQITEEEYWEICDNLSRAESVGLNRLVLEK